MHKRVPTLLPTAVIAADCEIGVRRYHTCSVAYAEDAEGCENLPATGGRFIRHIF